MPLKEVIRQLEMLKAEIEWDYSLEYQIALGIALDILERVEDEDRQSKNANR